jgi:hypothetical protein
MRWTLLGMAAAGLTLSAPASSAPAKAPSGVDPMDPLAWQIGPIIGERNYSVGMPLTPSKHPNGGWYFDIPSPDASQGHVHYVTFRHGSLSGKSRIVLRYRLEMAEGVQLVPSKEQPGTFPSILTLYFQRRGDNWSGTGKYEAYRWWATFASRIPITAGEHEISVPLDGAWSAVQFSNASSNSKGFREAIRDADRVGFTFGGGDGYGHGVYATDRARFVVTSFQVLGETDFGVRTPP